MPAAGRAAGIAGRVGVAAARQTNGMPAAVPPLCRGTAGGRWHEQRSGMSSVNAGETAPRDARGMSEDTPRACAGCTCGAGFPLPFTMAFQPILRLSSGAIEAHEALVRGPGGALAHSILGAVSNQNRPAFDRAARATALALAARLGLAERLHLNVMPDGLRHPEHCLGPLLEAASEAGIAPGRLTLELTEDGRLFDLAFMRRLIAACRGSFIRIAVDDLGAGHAAVGTLIDLGPDMVKLDLKLVRGIDRDRMKRARILDVIGACQGLGLEIAAVGVETEGELAVLADAGVDLAQGYLFAKPAFERLVAPAEIARQGLARAAA
jgi:EAL domain-containing protein (putative c-di-GMP-specific phosphodiesterase class I)